MATRSTRKKQDAGVKISDGAQTQADVVKVWSTLTYPIILRHVVKRYDGERSASGVSLSSYKAETFTINLGPNNVPREIWESQKDNPNIEKRLDLEVLIVNDKADRRTVRDLKARLEGHPMDKAELFDLQNEVTRDPDADFAKKIMGTQGTVIDENSSNDLGAAIIAG